MSTIGERIAKFREKTGLSTAKFGEKIGMSNAAVSNIETGKTENPGIDVIYRIIDVFGLTAEEVFLLLFGEQSENDNDAKKFVHALGRVEFIENELSESRKIILEKEKTIEELNKKIGVLEEEKRGLLKTNENLSSFMEALKPFITLPPSHTESNTQEVGEKERTKKPVKQPKSGFP